MKSDKIAALLAHLKDGLRHGRAKFGAAALQHLRSGAPASDALNCDLQALLLEETQALRHGVHEDFFAHANGRMHLDDGDLGEVSSPGRRA